MKKFVSAVAAVACLTAFGSLAANAGALPPSVTGPATLADLTGGGGVLLSDRIQLIGPTGGIFANRGVTETQESNCGSAGTALGNLFGAGLIVSNACEFGVPDHSVITQLPYNIAANSGQADTPTIVYEPDGVTISDIFGVRCDDGFNGGTGGCYLIFITDINDQPIVIPSGISTANWYKVTELAGGLGTIFDMTIYLDPDYQATSGITARFVDATEVPEPATLVLFGAGVAGLAVMRRRRKANKA